MRDAIAYTRVSTQGQGRSCLGLEAQVEAISRFAAQEGFRIIERFVEVETGKGADALERRPKLAAALKAAARSTRPARSSSPSSTGSAATCISSAGLWRTEHRSSWPSWARMPTRSCFTFSGWRIELRVACEATGDCLTRPSGIDPLRSFKNLCPGLGVSLRS